ncbi:MAG TPA: hypothetical protein VGN07_02475 [Steroidobacteraceae bacterium]|jgi:uncharacterized protein (TIGR02270 family)
MSHPARSPLPELIEESLGEAIFLWQRWEGELTSLTRNLDEVWSWTEDRLHGALAGVRVAADRTVAIATPGLASDNVHHVAVSAYLLASSTAADAAAALVRSLTTAQGPQLAAIVRALELVGSNATTNRVLGAAANALPEHGDAHNAALCRLKTFRRAAPGREMVPAFESNVPEHQAQALRAARYLQDQYVEEWIEVGLSCPHPDVQHAAIESGISRRLANAWHAAIERAARLDAGSARYLRIVALLGGAEEHEIVYDALRSAETQTQAIWALGHIGTQRAAEACLHGMKHAKLARHAGEAYCHITGADLNRDRLAVVEAPAEVPAFEADDLDANLVPQAEELWPLPDVDAVRRHWETQQAQFQPGVRHVHGRVANLETLLAAVETGPMLRRPDLALELAAKSHGRYDVETRAFVQRQRTMLASSRIAIANAAVDGR